MLQATIDNCTFEQNLAATAGAAIHVNDAIRLQVM
jgi:predicted outer membrane repeat protein